MNFYWLRRQNKNRYRIPKGFGPLHTAAFLGLTDYAAKLIKHNESMASNKTDSQRTPLSYAAEEGHSTTVEELLRYSAFNGHCSLGLHHLDYAAQNGHASVVRLLLLARADPYSPGRPCNRLDCCCGFIAKNVSYSYCMAIRNVYTQVVKEMISHSWRDPENGEYTLLHQVAREGRADIVVLLLEDGRIPVDSRWDHGIIPLFGAAYRRKVTVVKILLAHGASDVHRLPLGGREGFPPTDPSIRKGSSVLHALTHRILHGIEQSNRNNIFETGKLVMELLRAGADVNAFDRSGRTPPFEASANSLDSHITRVLLEHGANPSAMDERGHQPLHCASFKNVPFLVAAGADPNARRKDGATPLRALLAADIRSEITRRTTQGWC